MAIEAQAGGPDERISRMLARIQPVEDFRFRQMSWLQPKTEDERALSDKIAGEISKRDYSTFDKVMEAAVRADMKPLEIEDMGCFVSWLIVNFPVASGGEGDRIHGPPLTRLGFWHYAASKEGLTADERVRLAKSWLKFRGTEWVCSGEMDVAREFVEGLGELKVKRILEIDTSSTISWTYDDRDEERSGSDRELLTDEGYAAAKEQGWLKEKPSYVVHRAAQMLTEVHGNVDWFKGICNRLIGSK